MFAAFIDLGEHYKEDFIFKVLHGRKGSVGYADHNCVFTCCMIKTEIIPG